jgi:pimeloyl-ACP methyl ester carboxylesterase
MNRSAFLTATGGVFAMAALPLSAPADESAATLKTATGTLFGTLTLPSGAPPYPVVLIIAGSGPTDRDGNAGFVRGDTYKLLASALAREGVASLRYDKRGIAASAAAGSDEEHLRFDTYVDDAVAWVNQLRSDKRFSSLTIAGHSEGALIGTVAAERAPVHALVLLEGAGRPAAAVLREQLKPKLTPQLYAQADQILTKLQSGQTVADPPTVLAALFRPSVQPYLISWFKYDPAAELAKVRVPVTIVQGSADIQVTTADADALRKADPNAKVVLVNGMNHILKYYPDNSSMQAALKGYEDPTLPVDAHVVQAVEQAAKS